MVSDEYAAPRRKPAPLWRHPLTLDRRQSSREAYDRMVLRVRWFCLGVGAGLVMLIGTTLVDCLTRLGGHC